MRSSLAPLAGLSLRSLVYLSVRLSVLIWFLLRTIVSLPVSHLLLQLPVLYLIRSRDVKKKWENSSWGRKLIVQKRRASLNDFDRFKLMLAKIKKAGLIRQEFAKLKKQSA
ncbi:60S ribosomal protein L14-2 [Morus notabilis]|uniref:60S ribosomal protein L14-2 n=1 Tax=Morus notabilis TaxID=981085 RepID=W9S5X8_9ROSA|nr:60S ribosomal protein L14-2 [Morus notabilis]